MFLEGYDSHYICIECGERCEQKFNAFERKFEYKHPECNVIFVNGYPDTCRFNGKIMKNDGIEKVNTPIYSGGGFLGGRCL